MPIEVGKKAPAFKLPNHDGDVVGLDKWAGRWLVLYFYPRDDTPGCTVEACEFTASIKGFEKLDAVVVGVSPDTPASHVKFRAKHKLKVELLSDPEKKMLAAYGAWGMKTLYGRKFEGVIRSTVIVGPDGKVAHHWKAVKAAGHAGHVAAKIAELKKAKA
jgi:peroxiredoxin Q/BCP